MLQHRLMCCVTCTALAYFRYVEPVNFLGKWAKHNQKPQPHDPAPESGLHKDTVAREGLPAPCCAVRRTVEDCQGHVLYQQYLYQQDMLALAAMLQLPVACALGRSFEISSGVGAAAAAAVAAVAAVAAAAGVLHAVETYMLPGAVAAVAAVVGATHVTLVAALRAGMYPVAAAAALAAVAAAPAVDVECAAAAVATIQEEARVA